MITFVKWLTIREAMDVNLNPDRLHAPDSITIAYSNGKLLADPYPTTHEQMLGMQRAMAMSVWLVGRISSSKKYLVFWNKIDDDNRDQLITCIKELLSKGFCNNETIVVARNMADTPIKQIIIGTAMSGIQNRWSNDTEKIPHFLTGQAKRDALPGWKPKLRTSPSWYGRTSEQVDTFLNKLIRFSN